MDDELNLDLDNIEAQTDERLKVKNRFQQLSEKVKVTSQEKDEANAKVKAEAEARANAEKERDFYKDFSANVGKYPNASEYQDKILEKVKAGYSTEDAMVSVLNSEGKLTPNSQPVMQPITQGIEGGSAPTMFEGSKDSSQMSLEEKRSKLLDLERTGELQNALRKGM